MSRRPGPPFDARSVEHAGCHWYSLATFRSLADAWADTTTPHGRLILTVLGGLAEFERHLIVARTSEGRKRARAHGVLFGRPRKLTPHQRREAIARRDTGDETLSDIARSYNGSHPAL
jgi:DNA invertase Pin-like site-specific DNA recombinase